MGTNFYLTTTDRTMAELLFDVDYSADIYEFHIAKTSAGWLPLPVVTYLSLKIALSQKYIKYTVLILFLSFITQIKMDMNFQTENLVKG
jgi:hypothetical protein